MLDSTFARRLAWRSAALRTSQTSRPALPPLGRAALARRLTGRRFRCRGPVPRLGPVSRPRDGRWAAIARARRCGARTPLGRLRRCLRRLLGRLAPVVAVAPRRGAAGALPPSLASAASPSDVRTAITAPTAALCPSATLISRSTPESDASSSTSALSVSTSASGSPLATWSPGAFIQRMMTPSSMLSLSFGMRTSIAMRQSSSDHYTQPRRAPRWPGRRRPMPAAARAPHRRTKQPHERAGRRAQGAAVHSPADAPG